MSFPYEAVSVACNAIHYYYIIIVLLKKVRAD